MLRWFPLIVSVVLICSSCGAPSKNTIVIKDEPFSSQVNISLGERVYEYEFFYKSKGNCEFTPRDNSIPIGFSCKDGKCTLNNRNLNFAFYKNTTSPIPFIILNVVEATLGEELIADYNGTYKHYGSLKEGEYCLSLNSDGKIESIVMDSFDLRAEFL